MFLLLERNRVRQVTARRKWFYAVNKTPEILQEFYFKRKPPPWWRWSAESQNRTDDTAIFSRVLYQLSYLGLFSRCSIMRANFTRCMLIVKHRPRLTLCIKCLNLPFLKIYVIIRLRTSGCPPHPGVRTFCSFQSQCNQFRQNIPN